MTEETLTLKRGVWTLFLSASAAIRTTAAIVLLAAALNWTFVIWQLLANGTGAAAANNGTLIFVFGVLIPVLFIPLANVHGARVGARRIYQEHRDEIDGVLLKLMARRRTPADVAAATGMQADALDIARMLRDLPRPYAFALRVMAGRAGFDEWIGRLENAAGHRDAVSGVSSLGLAIIHEHMEERFTAGSALLIKIAFAVNIVLFVLAIFARN